MECQNCEKEFNTPIYIDDEPRCPNCLSSDVIVYEEGEDDYNPYCEVCGTCGYLGCCGIRNFIEEHIKGKTNCKNENIIINELIDLCDYKDEVFEKNDQLKEEIEELKQENEKLTQLWLESQTKRKNAIELIRKTMVESDITGNGTLNLNKLLEILGDKE